MIIGIALQAWREDTVEGTMAHQTMLFPTINRAFARTLSTVHPRTPWRAVPWDPTGDLWGSADVTGTLASAGWGTRWSGRWALTHDVTLFPMTDKDYADLLAAHDLPRNVGLRYTRALDARRAILVGAGAILPAELDTDPLPHYEGLAVGDGTVQARVRDAVRWVEGMVEARLASALNRLVPDAAVAKAAGPLKTQGDLGMTAPTPPAAGWTPPATPAAPVPVVPSAPEKPAEAPRTPAAPAPVVPPAPAKPVKPGEILIRPNGLPYIARKVDLGTDSISDVEMFRRGVLKGWCALAYGEPGTGKTAGFEVAFPGMLTMLGTAETTADDFIGGYVQTGPDTYEWVDGDLVVAMETGSVLFIDEIGLIDTRQLSVLYSVMDGRREVNVTSNPLRGKVRAVDGFGVVCATNPHAPGVRLSEALLSRCQIQLEVGTDYSIAESLGVPSRAVQAAQHLATLRRNDETSWAPEMRELLAFKDNEAEFGLVFALRALIAAAPELDREVVQTHLRERWGDLKNANKLIRHLSVD